MKQAENRPDGEERDLDGRWRLKRVPKPDRSGDSPVLPGLGEIRQNTPSRGLSAGPAPNTNHPLGFLLGRSEHPSRENPPAQWGPCPAAGYRAAAQKLISSFTLSLLASWRLSPMAGSEREGKGSARLTGTAPGCRHRCDMPRVLPSAEPL